jgi:GNAT superfamily N-acetyltransferase
MTHPRQTEVVKLMVLPSARLGVARKLIGHVEDFARDGWKAFSALDAASMRAAVQMYRRLGWEEWGVCKYCAS